MLLSLLLLWLPLTTATSNSSENLEETAECVKNISHYLNRPMRSFLGAETFKELVLTNEFFVDKSLLIREIFKENSPHMTVFYLPPAFRKTTNLRMIQAFAEIELYPNSFRISRANHWGYNFFTQGNIIDQNYTVFSNLLAPPLISRETDLVNKYAGRYPVVYFDFSLVHDIDYATSWNCIKDRIGRVFRKYHFLANRMHANEAERYLKLVHYFNTTEWSVGAPKEYIDLHDSVNFLAEGTAKFFSFKPILCIDNYDALLGTFLLRRYTTPLESDQVLKFFNDFVSKVLSRDDLWTKIILTGTHSVHKSIMKELPGSKAIYNAFDNDLSHLFGFTETEVRTIARHYHHSEQRLEQILEHYKGYQMNQNRLVYNPWSVLNSLMTGKMKNYWEKRTTHNRFLISFWAIRDLREIWLDLLNDRPVSLFYRLEKFTEDDFRSLEKILAIYDTTQYPPKPNHNLTTKEVNQVVLFWLDIGYLTCHNKSAHYLRAANLEVKKAMFEKMRCSYKGYQAVNVDQADVVAAKLHAYLFSHERAKLIDELTQSFRELFPEIGKLWNGNSIRDVSTRGNRIIEYMGLQLRYRHGHQIDRNVSNGFIAGKSGVFSIVVFNYDQTVSNTDVLDQIVNYKHAWIEQDPERSTTSVTYLVIGVKNVLEIVERRVGAEPPEDVTEPVSVEEVETTTKKKHTSASKKLNTVSEFKHKSTRPFNKTGLMTKKSTKSFNKTGLTTKKSTALFNKTGLATKKSTVPFNKTSFTTKKSSGSFNKTGWTTKKSADSSNLTLHVPESTSKFTAGGTEPSTKPWTTGISVRNATNAQSPSAQITQNNISTTTDFVAKTPESITRVKRSTSSILLKAEGPKSDPKVTDPDTTPVLQTKSIETSKFTSIQQSGSKSTLKVTKSTTKLPTTVLKTTTTMTASSESTTPVSTSAHTIPQSSPSTKIKVTNPDTTPVSTSKSAETTAFTSVQKSPSVDSTLKGQESKSNLKITEPTTELPKTDLKTKNTETAPPGNINAAETNPNAVSQSSPFARSFSKGSKSASRGTKPFKNFTRGTKFTKGDRKQFTATIIPSGTNMKLPSYSTWEYVSWKRRPKPTYSTKSTTVISRKKFLQLFFMVRDCDLRPDKKNPYYYQTIKTTKRKYTDRR